MIYIATEI